MSTVKTNRIEQLENTNLPMNLLPVTASAWVAFNGTGVPAIIGNHNVSSVTDNGVGAYTVNFTTALTNANYATFVTANVASGAITREIAKTTSSASVSVHNNSGAAVDSDSVNVVIFGGQ